MFENSHDRTAGSILAGGVLVFVALTGCATKGFVRDEVGDLRRAMAARTDRLESEMLVVRNSAEEAMQRAELAFGVAEESREIALGRVGFREVSQYTISFAFDSDAIDASAMGVLDGVASLIEGRPDLIIDVYGFADPTGPQEYNLMLGQRRADAVVRRLATRTSGPSTRFAAISFGESRVDRGGKSLLDSAAQQRRVVVSVYERTPPPQRESLPPPSDESS
jgi:outer membrane protein OmpA-like peptidoglycan-associated protein